MDLIEVDEELFLYLNNLGNAYWDPFWLFVTNKLSWIPLYLILGYVFFRKSGLKSTLIYLAFAGLMIFFTDQISHFYKDSLIRRFRPCYNEEIFPLMRLVKDTCGGKFGFFSGHATNHFAIAVFTGLVLSRFNWVMPLMLIWAGFIAYSRIYIGVHYPLDVLSGALIGSLSGLFFYRLSDMAVQKLKR